MKTEFEFLENIRRKFDLSKIGDDCAILPKDEKTDLVVTADLLIEDIDFRLDWAVPEFLGHKTLAVSLSDVAAMGAKPVWAMLSVGVPEKIWQTDFVEKFYDGWFSLAAEYDVELIGGDVSRSPDKIVIDSIVGGEIERGKAVRRSTARPGDLIYVTGSLGGAALGLKLLETGKRFERSEENQALRNTLLRQLRPLPRVETGRRLGENNLAAAMIDISDGLSGDLAHICRESRVGARIFADKIPTDPNASEILSENLDIFEFALNGGEDFELLFTVRPDETAKIFELQKKFFPGILTQIGEITEHIDTIELIIDGKARILEPESHTHF